MLRMHWPQQCHLLSLYCSPDLMQLLAQLFLWKLHIIVALVNLKCQANVTCCTYTVRRTWCSHGHNRFVKTWYDCCISQSVISSVSLKCQAPLCTSKVSCWWHAFWISIPDNHAMTFSTCQHTLWYMENASHRCMTWQTYLEEALQVHNLPHGHADQHKSL